MPRSRMADPGAESWLESEGRVLVTGLGIGRPQTQFGLTDGAPDRVVRPARRPAHVRGRRPRQVPARRPGRPDPDQVLWRGEAAPGLHQRLQARRLPDHRTTTATPDRARRRTPPAPRVRRHLRPLRHRHRRPRAVRRAPPVAACNAGLPTLPGCCNTLGRASNTALHASAGAGAQASSSSMISSGMSKLAKTFCTSSRSSRASIRRNTLAAPSLSSSTCMSGTNDASAES